MLSPHFIAISWKSQVRRYIERHAYPCGYYGDPVKPCTCSSGTVTKYQKRISGPLLDRIDIHIEVPRVEYDKLSDKRLGETSAAIQKRVESARGRQRERFSASDGVTCNADMRPAEVRQCCAPTSRRFPMNHNYRLTTGKYSLNRLSGRIRNRLP